MILINLLSSYKVFYQCLRTGEVTVNDCVRNHIKTISIISCIFLLENSISLRNLVLLYFLNIEFQNANFKI